MRSIVLYGCLRSAASTPEFKRISYYYLVTTMTDDYRAFGLPDHGDDDETPLVYASDPEQAALLTAQDEIDPQYQINDQTEEDGVRSAAMNEATDVEVYDPETDTRHVFEAWTWETRLPQLQQDEDQFPDDITHDDPSYKVEADVEERGTVSAR